jgi:integrase
MSSQSNDKLPKYVFRTEFGVFRFKRNVPKDIREVTGKTFFYKVLGKGYKEAMKAYSTALVEFDSFVASYRNEAPVRESILEIVKNEYGEEAMLRLARGQIDDNLDFALMDLSDKLEGQVSEPIQAGIYSGVLPEISLTLSQCLDRHLTYKLHGDEDRDRLPKSLSARVKQCLIEAIGSHAVERAGLAEITREDVNKFRDTLSAGRKPSTVVRMLNVVVAAVNFVITEDDLPIKNRFAQVVVKGSAATKDDRLPLSKEDIFALNKVFDAPDDIAALWTTLRDTGARLSEVVYLTVGDINLQDKSVTFGENALRKHLKTASSMRTIPLSNNAISSLQALRQGKDDNDPIFTRYARSRGADSASQMMMKRLRKAVNDPRKSIHSLRHAQADALRNSGCPEELKKGIQGHSDSSVASRYGSGFSLDVMRDAMEKVWA